MLDLGALLAVPVVEVELGFDLSPDGRKVAFAWNLGGSWEIYEIALEGKKPPRQVSSGPGAKLHPAYSPDGKYLAYCVDYDGSEKYHLILHALETDLQTDLTPNETGSLQANFAWAPDGRSIAYISDRSGNFDVYLLELASAGESRLADRLLFETNYPAWKVSWSPDGRHLAAVVEASGIDYGTFVHSFETGQTHRIGLAGEPIDAGQAAWSPDGQWLAFSSDASGFNNIGIYELATRQVTWLTEGECERQYPRWSPDGGSLVYVLNRGTLSWLVVQPLDGAPVEYQLEAGVHYLPQFTRDGKNLLFAFDNPRHPSDLWRLTLSDGKFAQLTHSLPASFDPADFVMPTEVRYPGRDGASIPALLFRSERAEPGPAVLVIHGGPDWFFECTWYPLMAHLASRGWTVLAPNYRGSTGYGRTWQAASRFDFGGVDTDDVACGYDYLVNNRLADPGRVGITGRSHGGYLTASCLTRYPGHWAVGSAVVPFLNWFTNHDEIRPDLQAWDTENFGDPVKDAVLWRERSPSFFLDQVRAPLQLICGRQDARCPVSDSIQAHAELTRMGKPVELLLYEDEGHTFLKKENILDAELRRVAFVAKVLEAPREGEQP